MADDPISRSELVKVEINKIFGRGFSRDHPDLTSAVMVSAAMDCLVGYIRTFARPLIEELIGTAWPDRPADPAMIDGSKITPTIHALLRDLQRIEFARGGRSRLTSPEEVRERTRERADQLVTTQDRMVAELEALHSLLRSFLEAAQQAAPDMAPDMAPHDMARDDSLHQSMRSLLEAAQQVARPVTSRTWREMTWSERWRWWRRTG